MTPKKLSTVISQLDLFERGHAASMKAIMMRLERIEAAQRTAASHSDVMNLSEAFEQINDALNTLVQHTQGYAADALDRGQTASALNGLAKRINDFQQRLLNPEVDAPTTSAAPRKRGRKPWLVES